MHQSKMPRMPTAADIIRALDLKPHPEGGHYRETFRDPRMIDGRAASTAIYFLLARGERSHWHRIDAVEIWHYYAGAPLKLIGGRRREGGNHPARRRYPCRRSAAGRRCRRAPGRRRKAFGDWTLVGCTVAPGFAFEGFELAPKGWSPRRKRDKTPNISSKGKCRCRTNSFKRATARARQPHDRQRRRARRLRPRHHAAPDRSGALSDVALARARNWCSPTISSSSRSIPSR